MRPKTELGNFFVEEIVLMEEQRLGAIAAQLDKVDTYLDTLTPLNKAPLAAYRLASGAYSFEDALYTDIFRGGSISEAHLTPVYDGYFSEEHPEMVIGSRCLRVQITPKKAMPFSRKPLPPAATFYMFAQQADLAEHHTPKDKAKVDTTENAKTPAQDPDGPPIIQITEPTLDQSRFPAPQVSAYRMGIVRRSGTIVCFSIEDNEDFDTVSVPEVEGASDHVLDMMPGAITIDRNPEKLQPLDVTGKFCGDLLRDLGLIAALKAPKKHRSWKSLFLKKTVVSSKDESKSATVIAGIPDPKTATPRGQKKGEGNEATKGKDEPKDVKE